MTIDTATTVDEEIADGATDVVIQQEFTCERCGYKYMKNFDRVPYLCNRCMRYIAKKVYTIMHTIQPALSTPTVPSDT